MLKSLKILPLRGEVSHEALFMERYKRLLDWSLQITDHDLQLAEDLVHDAFIQFSLSHPNLQQIRDLDAYLYVVLRNINISRVRRVAHIQSLSLTAADYDTAEIALRATNPRAQLNVREELRLVCRYACTRKETSKAGSLLILRYFHGYYPEEIAGVAHITRTSVYQWLKIARREAQLYLQEPEALAFMNESVPVMAARSAEGEQDFPGELIEMIRKSCASSCLTAEELKRLYLGKAVESILATTLAHVTTCVTCLDEINQVLRLPPLADRYPTDTLGPDSRPKDDSGGGSDGPSGPAVSEGLKQRSKKRLKEVFEHRPEELFVSVNGYVLGSQNISSEVNKLSLRVNIEEKINFIEVISEQGMRLLLLNVGPTPDEVEQQAQTELSDGRRLDLELNFDNPWPTVNLLYRDPLLRQFEASTLESEADGRLREGKAGREEEINGGLFSVIWSGLRRHWTHTRRWVLNIGSFSKPATVTAVFAVLLIAVLIFLQFNPPATTLLAADLLQQAAAFEVATAASGDQVIHRAINLEERKANGELVARRKVEVWQSAARGVTARRLYDERGQLIAGDWRRADGVQTLYHHSSRPRLQLAPEKRGFAPLSFDDVWQLELSAREFNQLISNTHSASVTERASTYVISYTSGNPSGLIKATLVLSRNDLHPIEQTLQLALTGEVREYRFTEASFERHSPNTVAPAVFEPEKELLNDGSATGRPGERVLLAPSPTLPLSASPLLATAELEVEVLGLLNQAGADLGEQINVTRSAAGVLRVEGLVESARRNTEILQALDSVRRNPAVSIEIQTVEEALNTLNTHNQRAATAPGRNSATATVETAEFADRVPADSELRRHFSARGLSGEALEQQIHSFATRVANRSQQVQAHAFALRSLANRFSVEDLRAMDQGAKTKWRSMIRAHAAALAREASMLRGELESVFPAVTAAGEVPASVTEDAELVAVIGQLFALASTNNQNIQSAFTISPRGAEGTGPKSAQFWRTLFSVENFARRIAE